MPDPSPTELSPLRARRAAEVLLHIARMPRLSGETQLARTLGRDPYTVRVYLRILEARGWVSRSRFHSGYRLTRAAVELVGVLDALPPCVLDYHRLAILADSIGASCEVPGGIQAADGAAVCAGVSTGDLADSPGAPVDHFVENPVDKSGAREIHPRNDAVPQIPGSFRRKASGSPPGREAAEPREKRRISPRKRRKARGLGQNPALRAREECNPATAAAMNHLTLPPPLKTAEAVSIAEPRDARSPGPDEVEAEPETGEEGLAGANLLALFDYGVRENARVRALCAQEGVTPHVIHRHAKRLKANGRLTPGLLIHVLEAGDPLESEDDYAARSRYFDWAQD